MITLPREGLTIDFVACLARSSILNPFMTIPLATSLSVLRYQDLVYLGWHKTLCTVISYLAALGLCLRATEFLNHKYNNNWTTDPEWDWNKEIVVITGGSSGIGAHLAQQLQHGDANTKIVIIDYVPLSWVPLKGKSVIYYKCDLGDISQIHDVCDRIRTEVGNPTVLVNNAGICRGATVCAGSYGDVEATMRINLIAPFLLLKEFASEMVQRNHGHIVNVSSMSALLPPAKVGDYAATKAGLMALHEVLQLELKNEHKANRVRLSLVVLSFTRTPLFKGETNQSHFWFPLLEVDSVSEAIAKILRSGYGKTIFMPGIMRYVAVLKGGPEWIWRLCRDATGNTRVDFTGRQKLDPKTGVLQ